MAEEHKNNRHEQEYKVGNEGGVESQDRGLFDFLGKKEEKKPQEEEVIATEFEKVKVSESDYQPHHVVQEEHKDEEKKKPSLLEKLHRSDSNSSSSSDEEEGEDEEKKKKKKEKKGLKEKIHEKVSGEKEEETSIPVEKYEESHVVGEGCQGEEKKGFLDKIKEKLPGQHKKTEEVSPPQHDQYQSEYAPTVVVSHHESEGEAKEKKGFLDKIKEKLPGYHPSKTEEDKEKEKEKEEKKEKDSATHY